jgi:hypothetical protein
MPYEKVSIYLDCDLTQQEYELIKEVLGEWNGLEIKKC